MKVQGFGGGLEPPIKKALFFKTVKAKKRCIKVGNVVLLRAAASVAGGLAKRCLKD